MLAPKIVRLQTIGEEWMPVDTVYIRKDVYDSAIETARKLVWYYDDCECLDADMIDLIEELRKAVNDAS